MTPPALFVFLRLSPSPFRAAEDEPFFLELGCLKTVRTRSRLKMTQQQKPNAISAEPSIERHDTYKEVEECAAEPADRRSGQQWHGAEPSVERQLRAIILPHRLHYASGRHGRFQALQRRR